MILNILWMTARWLKMWRSWPLKREITLLRDSLSSDLTSLGYPDLLLSSMACYLLMLDFLYFALRVFGHFSLRSEWQLVKVDYKSIFSRRCTKEDFETWHLLNQVPDIGMCWPLETGTTASWVWSSLAFYFWGKESSMSFGHECMTIRRKNVHTQDQQG